MPGQIAPKDLTDYLGFVMDRLILPEPPSGDLFILGTHGEGLAFDGTLPAPRPADTLFSLCLGAQWLDRQSGGNACVLVPGLGGTGPGPTGSAQKTLQSGGAYRTLFSLRWSIEIHVWGREAPANVTGRARDVQRYKEALTIFKHVSRVMYLAAYGGYAQWDSVQGFNAEASVTNYGESLAATLYVIDPVYDYKRTYITLPQVLTPANGQPVAQNGVST